MARDRNPKLFSPFSLTHRGDPFIDSSEQIFTERIETKKRSFVKIHKEKGGVKKVSCLYVVMMKGA